MEHISVRWMRNCAKGFDCSSARLDSQADFLLENIMRTFSTAVVDEGEGYENIDSLFTDGLILGTVQPLAVRYRTTTSALYTCCLWFVKQLAST